MFLLKDNLHSFIASCCCCCCYCLLYFLSFFLNNFVDKIVGRRKRHFRLQDGTLTDMNAARKNTLNAWKCEKEKERIRNR